MLIRYQLITKKKCGDHLCMCKRARGVNVRVTKNLIQKLQIMQGYKKLNISQTNAQILIPIPIDYQQNFHDNCACMDIHGLSWKQYTIGILWAKA